MNNVLTPQTRPASLLAPGLIMVILFSTAVTLLRVAFGEVPGGIPASKTQLLVFAGVISAFTGFLIVLFYSAIVWIYSRAVRSQSADFVRALALVAFAFGLTATLKFLVSGVELLVTGDIATVPITDVGRYAGSGLRGLDLADLLTVVLLYVGARSYLRYGIGTAVGLASILLLLNVFAGAIV